MTIVFSSDEERAVVEAEQIKAFFRETNDQNIAGALVMTLLVYVAHEGAEVMTWLPAMAGLYLVTLYRAWTIYQYRRAPEQRSVAVWRRGQILSGGWSGVCWGIVNTALLTQVSIEYQLFILTVVTVSAATNASEGFAFPAPSRAFILLALVPPTLWLVTVNDRIHEILALMLAVFIPMTLWQGHKRSLVFMEAQQLRFRNEALASELTHQCAVAEQASLSKGRFLAAASHDLRQPMQALTIFHELLEREMTEQGRTSSNLDNARKAATSMNSLLDALLDISKLDADVVLPDPRPFPIQLLLDELARDFLPLARQKGLELRVRPCSAVVMSDRTLLTRVLNNLVSNAIRYTVHGKVLVGCRRRAASIELMVLDTGLGIAAEHQQEVFGEFFQVENKARDRQQGIGLGLAIVERIARLLEHPLGLRSVLGQGSCFSLVLPRLPQTPLALPPDGRGVQDEGLVGQSGRTLLLVDDEAEIRLGLSRLVAGWGYEVIAVASADEALAALRDMDREVDGVISDMRLPGAMDGIELIASLRQRFNTELPAVLVTGDTSGEALQAARQAGLVMLHKPVRPARLRSALAAMLHPADS